VNAAEEKRLAILEHCDSEIRALLREAKEDGVNVGEAVILVADSRDELGQKLVAACAEVGQPVEGAEVYVVGVHVSMAEEILRRVAPEHIIDLYDDPPPNAAHLLCFAAGGVRASFVAEQSIAKA
jgi:hypothetical protein